jgi:hypothetical protein
VAESYPEGLVVDEILGFWAPRSCLVSPERESLSFMSPGETLSPADQQGDNISKFPDDLVFVFNDTEVAGKVNHFGGISDEPNCCFEVGGKEFTDAPNLCYSLRLIKDSSIPCGQLLADYGKMYAGSEDGPMFDTVYDKEKGPFGPSDHGTTLGGDTTLVNFWRSSYNFIRTSAPRQVIAADDSDDSADSGDDEGDDNPTGGVLESQTQSAIMDSETLEKKIQKFMERDGMTYEQAATIWKAKNERKAARAAKRAAKKAAKKMTTPAKGNQGAKTSTPQSSKPKIQYTPKPG